MVIFFTFFAASMKYYTMTKTMRWGLLGNEINRGNNSHHIIINTPKKSTRLDFSCNNYNNNQQKSNINRGNRMKKPIDYD